MVLALVILVVGLLVFQGLQVLVLSGIHAELRRLNEEYDYIEDEIESEEKFSDV